jgi:hypothetical protein
VRAVAVPAPSFGFDTVQNASSATPALGAFAIRYLGSLTLEETQSLTDAGLGVMGVTYAGSIDGYGSVVKARAAGLAPGTTLWIDVESTGAKAPVDIVRDVNSWAEMVKYGGYQAGMYVGVESKLTSSELSALAVTRYWKACSECIARDGTVQEPQRGFCLYQLRMPNVARCGLIVDVVAAQADYRGDVPVMSVA